MNILKSAVVLLVLIFLVCATVRRVKKSVQQHRENVLKKSFAIFTILCVIFSTFAVVVFGKYIYPFERKLHPKLIAELTIAERYELDYPGQEFWHGAYAKFGLYADSFHFDENQKQSDFGFAWPEMDLKNHSYIITYGRTIKSLSYNVWETIDIPIRTGAYVGHMKLNDDFVSDTVYVYEIPRIRIENDVNDVRSPWDWG